MEQSSKNNIYMEDNKLFKKIKDKNFILEDNSLFLPLGYEKIFLLLHSILLPYIAGLLFIFLYISEAEIYLFSVVLDEHSFFLTWCIGYEILIFLFLLGLTVKSLTIMRPKKETLTRF